jgi:hypothetical protein
MSQLERQQQHALAQTRQLQAQHQTAHLERISVTKDASCASRRQRVGALHCISARFRLRFCGCCCCCCCYCYCYHCCP